MRRLAALLQEAVREAVEYLREAATERGKRIGAPHNSEGGIEVD
jgi:hypothetical protein